MIGKDELLNEIIASIWTDEEGDTARSWWIGEKPPMELDWVRASPEAVRLSFRAIYESGSVGITTEEIHAYQKRNWGEG